MTFVYSITSNTILEVHLMKDPTEPNFTNASSKSLQRVATVPSNLETVFGKLPSPDSSLKQAFKLPTFLLLASGLI